jgi:hypothetical protein
LPEIALSLRAARKRQSISIRLERTVGNPFDVKLFLPKPEKFPIAPDAIGRRLHAPLSSGKSRQR